MSTKKVQSSLPSAQQPGPVKKPRFQKVVVIDDAVVDLFVSETIIKSVEISRTIFYELKASIVIDQLRNTERLSDVPELIFLDLKMDNVDGFRFLEEFKKLSDFIRDKCKIIVVSSSDEKEDKKRALLDPNVIRYFRKPLDVYMVRDLLIN